MPTTNLIRDNPLPRRLRDIRVVKRRTCASNLVVVMTSESHKGLETEQILNEHNVDEVSLHIDCDSNTVPVTARAPSDIAALIVKPNGTAAKPLSCLTGRLQLLLGPASAHRLLSYHDNESTSNYKCHWQCLKLKSPGQDRPVTI